MTDVDRRSVASADGTPDLPPPVVIKTRSTASAACSTGLARSRAARVGWLSSAVLIAGLAAPSLGTAQVAAPAQGTHQEAHEGKSSDEIAKELANPNSSLASLKFRNQYRSYTGDLPGADNQGAYTMVFQPVFPFPMGGTASGGKANFYVRPAIPLLVEQPVPTPSASGVNYDKKTALGDIGFDVAYGVTEKTGLLWALGMAGTLPTASDHAVAGKQLRLGPEVLLAKSEKWGIWGVFPNHQWNVAGWGENTPSYSTTTVQPIFVTLPGGGWKIGSEPIMSYDWRTSKWTAPVQLLVGKTIKIGDTPVGIDFEVNYYFSQPDAFGPKWMFAVNITPVVPNFINNWIRGIK
jgi:hypothetical protein